MKLSNLELSTTQVKIIETILNKGNQVEIKKEKDNIVIIEIVRSVQSKTTLMTG